MIRDLEEEFKLIIILWYHFSVNHSVFYGTYFTVPYNIVIITKAPADDQQVLSFSRGNKSRTRIDGFGDRCSTIELCPFA